MLFYIIAFSSRWQFEFLALSSERVQPTRPECWNTNVDLIHRAAQSSALCSFWRLVGDIVHMVLGFRSRFEMNQQQSYSASMKSRKAWRAYPGQSVQPPVFLLTITPDMTCYRMHTKMRSRWQSLTLPFLCPLIGALLPTRRTRAQRHVCSLIRTRDLIFRARSKNPQ